MVNFSMPFTSRFRQNMMFIFGFLLGMTIFCLTSGGLSLHGKLYFNSEDWTIFSQNAEIEREDENHQVDSTLADHLAKKVRLFVIILTMPKSKLTKAVHVKATWARRFNGYIFISSTRDDDLPSIAAVPEENRNLLWEKTRIGLTYAYENHLNDYNFFMKADDDTYVIVENLRLILSKLDPNKPFIMGRRFNKFVRQGYPSGGAGYVLSRAALKLIVEGMQKNLSSCSSKVVPEDVGLGQCAESVGVQFVDSLDKHGQETFHPFSPSYTHDQAAMNGTAWIFSYNYYPLKSGLNSCSDHSVSFHYVSPNTMYEMEYLIYHLHPHGLTRDLEQYEELLRLKGNQTL